MRTCRSKTETRPAAQRAALELSRCGPGVPDLGKGQGLECYCITLRHTILYNNITCYYIIYYITIYIYIHT